MLVGALADAGADQAAITDAIASLDAGRRRLLRKGQALAASAPPSSMSRYRRPRPTAISRNRQDDRDGRTSPSRANATRSRVFRNSARPKPQVHQVPHREGPLPRSGRGRFHRRYRRRLPSRSICSTSRRVVCSPLNVGSGTVKTEHGILPVPAPATARLLAGKPIYARGPALELTTPTGAAVAVTLADALRRAAADEDRARSGYGAGDHDFPDHANVLRVMLGETHRRRRSAHRVA